MKSYFNVTMLALVGAICAVTSPAFAQSLLQNLPVKIQIGNGTPLTGTSTSKIGVGVLSPKVNGTPISLRLLGTDKTAGVYIKNKALGSDPVYLKLETPIDGVVNAKLPK